MLSCTLNPEIIAVRCTLSERARAQDDCARAVVAHKVRSDDPGGRATGLTPRDANEREEKSRRLSRNAVGRLSVAGVRGIINP